MLHIIFAVANQYEILPLLEFAKSQNIQLTIISSLTEELPTYSHNPFSALIINAELIKDGELQQLITLKNQVPEKIYTFILGELKQAESIDAAKTLAAEFFPKPLTLKIFRKIIAEIDPSKTTPIAFKSTKKISLPTHYGNMVGNSPPMQRLYEIIGKVAPTEASVFVIGKSGTGKELVAQAIHEYSKRTKMQFLAINCGAIASELIASALFGHEKGSFTGALHAHKGYFEQASGGTLFLDEITETSLDLQVKLLRVLETGKVIPVGGKRQIAVNVRIIASTNRDPAIAVKKGILREDLYYRLNVFPITLPLLQERGDDILLLANYFLEMYNRIEGHHKNFSEAATILIRNLSFSGNVRELKNLVYRSYILADKIISPEHIHSSPNLNKQDIMDDSKQWSIAVGTPLNHAMYSFVQWTLQQCDQNIIRASKSLGVSITEIERFLKENAPKPSVVKKESIPIE